MNPFFFDVHAGVFVLLLNLCNGVNLTSSSGLYSFEPLSIWHIGQEESLKPTEMHELHAKLVAIVTLRNN